MNYLDDGSSYDLNLAISYEELLRARRRALKKTYLLPASVHGSNFFFFYKFAIILFSLWKQPALYRGFSVLVHYNDDG